jgi:hypothetical protein
VEADQQSGIRVARSYALDASPIQRNVVSHVDLEEVQRTALGGVEERLGICLTPAIVVHRGSNQSRFAVSRRAEPPVPPPPADLAGQAAVLVLLNQQQMAAVATG